MTLLVEYKYEQANPSIYSIKHKYIKYVIYMNNKSMHDIKHKWERNEQSQARENCFEIRAPLLYVPAFYTMKYFH